MVDFSRSYGEVRNTKTVAADTNAIDKTKCSETTHGFRSVSTEMPPMTAWNGMPSAMSVASQRSPGVEPRRRNTASHVPMATTTRTQVSIRFPNSMAPCIPSA
ncbi:Uncharacterised protein [Mycobacteroides abscessus subsp. abscessus]|nr:Uncharacterised protein [Mycobacteroides abscessus subsp. abscessus]